MKMLVWVTWHAAVLHTRRKDLAFFLKDWRIRVDLNIYV